MYLATAYSVYLSLFRSSMEGSEDGLARDQAFDVT